MTANAESRRLQRYLIVTAVAAPVNLAVYVALMGLGAAPVLANTLAASLIAPATFVAYRSWVWRVGVKPTLRGDVVPYWVATVVNVGLACGAIFAAQRITPSAVAIAAAPPVTYAAVTVLRFLQLDRWIFATNRRSQLSPGHEGSGVQLSEENPQPTAEDLVARRFEEVPLDDGFPADRSGPLRSVPG